MPSWYQLCLKVHNSHTLLPVGQADLSNYNITTTICVLPVELLNMWETRLLSIRSLTLPKLKSNNYNLYFIHKKTTLRHMDETLLLIRKAPWEEWAGNSCGCILWINIRTHIYHWHWKSIDWNNLHGVNESLPRIYTINILFHVAEFFNVLNHRKFTIIYRKE